MRRWWHRAKRCTPTQRRVLVGADTLTTRPTAVPPCRHPLLFLGSRSGPIRTPRASMCRPGLRSEVDESGGCGASQKALVKAEIAGLRPVRRSTWAVVLRGCRHGTRRPRLLPPTANVPLQQIEVLADRPRDKRRAVRPKPAASGAVECESPGLHLESQHGVRGRVQRVGAAGC